MRHASWSRLGLVPGSLLLVIATTALAPRHAHAVWGTHGLRLSTSSAAQDLPVAVSDGAEGSIVIWRDSRGADRDLYAQRVLADGTIAWAAAGVLVANGPGDPVEMRGCPDGQGGAIVSWTLATGDVRAQRIDANGAVAVGWPLDGVSVGGGWYDHFALTDPQCVPDGAGGAWIAWHQRYIWRLVHILASGQTAAATTAGAPLGTTEPEYVSITATGTGDVIAGSLVFHYTTVEASKTNLVTPGWSRTIAEAPMAMLEVSAVPDMTGGAYIAWLGAFKLALVRVREDGSFPPGWPVNGVVLDTTSGSPNPGPRGPKGLASDGQGGALFANQAGAGLRLKRITPSSQHAAGWPASGVTLTSVDASAYGTVKDGSGGAFVAWVEGGRLHAQHVMADATFDPAWPVAGHPICEAAGQEQPSVVSTEDGGAIVAWSDTRGASPWIFAHPVRHGAFQGEPAPHILSLEPTTGVNVGPVTVTALGTGFMAGATARLARPGESDIVGTGVVVNPVDSMLTATFDITGATAGPWSYVVQNPNGIVAIRGNGFTVLAVPRADSIVPAIGHNAQAALAVRVHGAAFAPSAQVLFHRSGVVLAAATTAVTPDGSRIDAVVDLVGHDPGLYDVIVRNGPGAEDLLQLAFRVTAPPPVISGVVPVAAVDTAAAQALTVSGNNFVPGATLSLTRLGATLQGTNVQVDGSGTELTADVDLRPGADGLWDVRVENLDGGVGVRTGGFRIDAMPQPVSVAPIDGADTELRDVIVSGTRFVPGSQLVLSRAGEAEAPASNESVNAAGTEVSGRFDLRGIALGAWDVSVRHPAGLAVATLAGAFQVFAGPKVVSIVPPFSDRIPAANVTIDGRGFQPGAQVSLEALGHPPIDGSDEIVSPDGTQIATTFALSSASPGFRDLVVRNPDGRVAVVANGFRVFSGPSLESVTPDAAPDTGVAVIVLGGAGLSSGATARLHRTGQADIVGDVFLAAVDGTSLQAAFDLSGRALGAWDVTVQNPSGMATTVTGGFEIVYGGPTSPSGLDITWNACNLPETAGSLATFFDCADPGFVSSLYANFQTPVPLPDFVVLDATIDFEIGTGVLPPFWRYEPMGCNADGLVLGDAMPAVCPTASNRSPWGSGGGRADAVITAYAPNFNGDGHARLLISVVRAADDPFPLAAGENYFGFSLTWTGDLTGCVGCESPGDVTWTSALLHSVNDTPAPVALSGSGRRSNHVTLNVGPTATPEPTAPASRVSGIRSIAPNPVMSRTRIEYSVARPGPVRVSVLDLQGREVAVLVDERLEAGTHGVTWEGRDERRALPGGLYFVRYADATRRQVARLTLAR